jgi:hypothetical protein
MNACLAAFVSSPSLIAGRVVKIYQDVPYAARTPNFSGEMLAALAQAGVKLEPESIPIAPAFEQKLRLVSLYASQFKIGAMRQDIESSAHAGLQAKDLVERFWTICALPDRLDAEGIHSLSADTRQQEMDAERWLAKNERAPRVRVLLLLPTGRWTSDLERLRRAFPSARYEVIAAPAAAAEVCETPSDAVDVREVGAGARAWALLATRLTVARPMPTLFLAGERRIRVARWLARMWPSSDTLVVASMNGVSRAMERRCALAGSEFDRDAPA